MLKSTQLPFNKLSSSFLSVLFAFFLLSSIMNIIPRIQSYQLENWILVSAMLIFLLVILIFFIIKQLIPAFQGKCAIELNENGIISYVNNISISLSWCEIENVRYYSGKGTRANVSSIAFDLVDPKAFKSKFRNPFTKLNMWLAEKFRATPFVLSLYTIEGDSKDIYNMVYYYLFHYKAQKNV
jgi:hypothetical protein